MFRPPDEFDEDNLLERLLEDDAEQFREQYSDRYRELSEEDARRSIEEEFRSVHQPEYSVFKAVKDSFHPANEEGYRSGYEVSFTNPLYEIRENPADLLLTYTDYQNVSFCFVVCEVVGEDYTRWPAHINEVHDLVMGHESHLLKQVGEEGKEINTIQYVTATRKQDVPDIDFRHIERLAPDNYSLWVVDDDYPRESPSDPHVQLHYEDGSIQHQKLRTVMGQGIDYERSRNRDVIFSLESHPIIALQETIMALMTEQHSDLSEEQPREFDRGDFERVFIDLCEIGPSGEEKREVLRETSAEFLELAKNAEMVYADGHRRIQTSRDFRARYPTGSTAEVKPSIRDKYVDYRAPYRRGRMAYDDTRESFESRSGIETNFESSEWQEDDNDD